MMAPRFSVLLCNYNDARYLPAALHSILDQTPGPEQVLVVDDGSTDDSPAILNEWVARHPVMEVVRNHRNLGPIASANAVLPRIRGDYLSWWSADDVVMPGLFASAAEAARRFPEAAVIASRTEAVAEPEIGTPPRLHDFGLTETMRWFDPEAFCRANRRRYLWLGSSGLFLRTECLRAQGGWNGDFDWFTDWVASYSLALTHGVALMNMVGSRVLSRRGSFGANAKAQLGRRRGAIIRFLDYLRRPENRALRRRFASASLALPYALGDAAFRELVRRPQDWDLLSACGLAWIAHRMEVKLRGGMPPLPRTP